MSTPCQDHPHVENVTNILVSKEPTAKGLAPGESSAFGRVLKARS